MSAPAPNASSIANATSTTLPKKSPGQEFQEKFVELTAALNHLSDLGAGQRPELPPWQFVYMELKNDKAKCDELQAWLPKVVNLGLDMILIARGV